jgi:hypothetical protein
MEPDAGHCKPERNSESASGRADVGCTRMKRPSENQGKDPFPFPILSVSSFVSQFKYLGRTITNNFIQGEIKRRMNSGNVCYHSVQNLLSSRLLSKNVKIRIYKTIISPVVLYGCETWSLTLREEHKLRVFENRVLRRGIE